MMAHEFFRYLIPGIIFYLPLCLAAGGMYLFYGDTIFAERLKNTGALLGIVAVPTGWFIYQAWRTIWHLYRGGYEPQDFLERIRQAVRVYEQEVLSRILIDFTPVLGEKVGMRWFSAEEFECVFDPFKPLACRVGFNSGAKRSKRAKGRRWYLHFVEPVSDLVLFGNESYDYARSVASARYSISVGIFAAGCGTVLALAASFWHWYPASLKAKILLTFLVLMFSIVLAWLVWQRREMATNEHFSRVQLITHINCTDRFVSEERTSSLLDSELLVQLQRMPIRGAQLDTGTRLVAFDMDGTLIRHDIGDAVLAMLIYEGLIRSEAWKTYQQLLKDSRLEGYKFAVTTMSGLSVNDVYQATRLALKPGLKEIPVPVGEPVKRPTVSLKMQALVMWLHRQGYDTYVVTATNRWAAAIVASDFFGISEKHVFGVEVEVKRGRLTDQLVLPAPIGVGKVETWRKHLDTRRPLFGAGDSKLDHPLLSLVDESGLVLWLGHPEQRPPGNNVIVTTLD